MSGYSFYVDIEYEKLHNFCNYNKNVGYSIIKGKKAKITWSFDHKR